MSLYSLHNILKFPVNFNILCIKIVSKDFIKMFLHKSHHDRPIVTSSNRPSDFQLTSQDLRLEAWGSFANCVTASSCGLFSFVAVNSGTIVIFYYLRQISSCYYDTAIIREK